MTIVSAATANNEKHCSQAVPLVPTTSRTPERTDREVQIILKRGEGLDMGVLP